MENSKVKALFFAQYFNQNLLYKQGYNNCLGAPEWYIRQTYENGFDENDNWFLLLRAVDQLTDEELVAIAKLAYGTSWEDSTCIASKVPNHDNVHSDIVSIEIETFINYPPLPKYYKCCHIQIDTVDADINMLRFTNDGKETSDDIIGSVEQWAILDYLRSIGILLPFTYIDENGKPQTLQPDEIVSKGWAKVQHSNDK